MTTFYDLRYLLRRPTLLSITYDGAFDGLLLTFNICLDDLQFYFHDIGDLRFYLQKRPMKLFPVTCNITSPSR